MNILQELSNKESNKEKLAQEVIKSPSLIPELLKGLHNKKVEIKFGSDKVLRIVSEQSPKSLYPYFDTFVESLDSENNIIKWGAIIVIANLTSVDDQRRFEKIFDKYYASISQEVMITAANIISHSWKIALAKPDLTEKITTEILKGEKTKYIDKGKISPECTNIVCGKAIESFDQFFNKIKDKKPVLNFVKRQLSNSRNAVAKKAEKFLKKHTT